MTDILTEVRFWAQVIGDMKRTVFCNPELESRVKGWVDARDMGHLITVHANRACPLNQVYIFDEQAIQAETNRLLNQPIRIWR